MVFDRPRAFLLYLNLRPNLHLAEIKEVKRALTWGSGSNRTKILTINGEILYTNLRVALDVLNSGSFYRTGSRLVNKVPCNDPEGLVVEVAYTKLLVLWLMVISLTPLTMLVSDLTDGRLAMTEGICDAVMIVVMVLTIGGLLPLAAYWGLRETKRSRREDTMRITDDIIEIPQAPGPLKVIPRGAILSIETFKRWMDAGLVINTEKGFVTLPLSASVPLEEAGYEVSDAHNVLPMMIDNPFIGSTME
jgi:hypothetical protein